MDKEHRALVAQRSATLKVGILTMVSLALLVFALIWLKGRGLAGGEIFTVRFRDVDGLKEGAPVQLMGIRVGFVEQVAPIVVDGKYYVNVNFRVSSPQIHPPAGSTLSIEQSGFIGEKFLEITPPRTHTVALNAFAKLPDVKKGMPVKFLYEEGYLPVGQVDKAEPMQDENMWRYTLQFRITRPGAAMPRQPVYELAKGTDGKHFLRVIPQDPTQISAMPDRQLFFTIENPMRLKEFLDVQMESAEALKRTNDKIVELLNDETIATLNSTVKNTEILTARATEVLDSTEALFKTTSRDLDFLVNASNQLVNNISQVSNNVNDVIGNPQVKADIQSTVASVRQSSVALNKILQDPALPNTLSLVERTATDASALVGSLRETAEDRELRQRLDGSLTNLNQSLERLSTVLASVESLTTETEDDSIHAVVRDLKQTSDNLRKFSAKLGGRFTLFRLIF